MEIEIRDVDLSGVNGYELFDVSNEKLLKNRYGYDLNDVFNLIGEKEFVKFENGKGLFNIKIMNIYAVTRDMRYYKPKDWITHESMLFLENCKN